MRRRSSYRQSPTRKAFLSSLQFRRAPTKSTPGLPDSTRATSTSVTLEVGQSKTLNITLAAGDVKQSVTVTDEAPLVTTDRADRGTVVENQFVTSIPLLTRNPLLLVTMTAGAIGTDHTGRRIGCGRQHGQPESNQFFPHQRRPQPVQ